MRACVTQFGRPSEKKGPRTRVRQFGRPSEEKGPRTRVRQFGRPSEEKVPRTRVRQFGRPSEKKVPRTRVRQFARPSEEKVPRTRVRQFGRPSALRVKLSGVYICYVMLCSYRSLRVRSRTHVRRGLHATARARPRHGATPATPSDRPAQKTDHPRKRRGAANLRVLSTALLVAGAAVVVVDPGVARGQRQRRLIGLVHTRRRRKHSRLRRNPDVRLHYALPTWRRLA